MIEKQRPATNPTNSKLRSLGRRIIGMSRSSHPDSARANTDSPDTTYKADSWEMPPRPFEADGRDMAKWAKKLERQGETVKPGIMHEYNDVRFLEGLKQVSRAKGVDPTEYIKHSNRFFSIVHSKARFDGLTRGDDYLEIPPSPDNLYANGQERHHDRGRRVQLDYLEKAGIDPSFVLYFRVTQPAPQGPKPEYYWTSDLQEVTHSLFSEGSANGEPLILVSTLQDIAQNGGLIADVNDDQGFAVRQIGLEPFDQQNTLFMFPRFGRNE